MQPTPTETARAVAQAWQRAYSAEARPPAADPAARMERWDRAASDAAAAHRRWQAPAALVPQPPEERRWFGILDRARAETLASQDLPGMALNLGAVDAIAPAEDDAARLYKAARALLGGQEYTEAILPPLLPQIAPVPPPAQGAAWLGRIRDGFRRRPPARPALPTRVAEMTDAAARGLLLQARTWLKEPEAFARAIHPLVQWLAQHAPAAAETAGGLAPAARAADAQGLSGTGAEQQEAAARQIEAPGGAGVAPATVAGAAWPGYEVYSRQWDEVRSAASFLMEQRSAGDPALPTAPGRDQIRRLAHRLQRRLLSARLRTWSFDQEEGLLDSRRLARLLVPGGGRNVFRQERDSPIPHACVTLLVEQSGSMDGKRRTLAALAIDLAVHALETCGIATEVLGYTTRYGADAPPLAQWRLAGSPAAPGRLNALRHIIYKGAAQPWRRCRSHLGLLLRQDLGHENIDGEALDWAATRLAGRPEPRKILIVLSDGSPFDAATQQAHDRSYLENHLRQVITALEASPIHLVAIGTGHDVGRFYRHAATVRRPDAVAEALFEQLGDLLTRLPRSAELP